MDSLIAYGGLFLSAFVSATILPGTSEATMVLLLHMEKGTPLMIYLVATVANVLGSIFNWLCGRFLSHYSDRKWFPVSREQYERAIVWYEKYGKWSLLFAWVPFVGDPLTLAAGVLRVKFWFFLPIVAIGKAVRYFVVIQAAMIVVG